MPKEKEYLKFEEKVALAQRVENLPVNEHPNIYRIVNARDPSTLEDCQDDPNWTYVLFHLLRPSTLRELESYLASRNVNTQSEIRENNPDVESEESTAKSTEYTAKLRSRKGSKSDAEAADSKSGDGAGSKSVAESGSKSDAGGDSKSDAGGDSKSGAGTGSKNEAGTGARPKSEGGTSSKREAGSIKTRLRKTSKKSDAGSSKQV